MHPDSLPSSYAICYIARIKLYDAMLTFIYNITTCLLPNRNVHMHYDALIS